MFQAYDGMAAQELCEYMPQIDLLVLNTEGTGADTPALVRKVRETHRDLPVLHIGNERIAGMPEDVANLSETFSVPELLATVHKLLVVPERG